jgi:hypothetical protein
MESDSDDDDDDDDDDVDDICYATAFPRPVGLLDGRLGNNVLWL